MSPSEQQLASWVRTISIEAALRFDWSACSTASDSQGPTVLLWSNTGELYHRAPFLGFLSEEFSEIIWRTRDPAADALDGTIIVYAGAKDRLLDTGVSCGVKSVGNGKAAQGGCSAEQAILSIVDMFIGVLDFDDDDARQCALRSI
jgi:hypothetical protein